MARGKRQDLTPGFYGSTCKQLSAQLCKAGIPAACQKQINFDGSQDTVRLISFHRSKGLEFPLVVIPGMDALSSTDEEEARLLYVAMTRATKRLVVGGRLISDAA